jgi:hypothetical protein
MPAQARQIESATRGCKNNQHRWTTDHICATCASRRCRATCAMSGSQCLHKASPFPDPAGKPLTAELENLCINHLDTYLRRRRKSAMSRSSANGSRPLAHDSAA